MISANRSFIHPEFLGRIGLSRAVITPPEGMYARLWGSATHDIADGIHQPMLASCLVLKSDAASSELVLITLDAIVLHQEEADRIRDAIVERFGLQPRQLMLHPSHTHSSPALVRRHADRPGGHLIAPYLDSLPGTCCELIAAARADARPRILGWTYGRCALAFNRDSAEPSSGRGVCGINRDHTADDTLIVGRISDPAGTVRGVVVNYACHPVSLGGANKLISPDFVGPMRQTIKRETGGVCLFLQGASGNLTPRRSYEALTEAAEQNGRELGFAALAALSGMLPPGQRLDFQKIEESGTPLGIWGAVPKERISSMLEATCTQIDLP